MESMLNKEPQVLCDISALGKKRLWKEKKKSNLILAEIYKNVNRKKSERLSECAGFLVFNLTIQNRLQLKTMNSCRVRLCPICSWRRTLKIYSHMSKIMNQIKKEKEYGYLFLTLTVENISGGELCDRITEMMQGFQRFMQRKKVRDVVKGWYRGLEITYNEKNNTYHPHFHVVVAVNKSYFTDTKKYISQKEWVTLWKEAMRLEYTPIVDIRKVKGNTAKAVTEIAKYTVKDSDYIRPYDLNLSEEIVRVLDQALDKRRLVAYGGKFKELHKKLNLDDEMEGDLINVGDEKLDFITEQKIMYVWNVGYSNYFRVDSF